jgi:hypothetical protein
VDLPVTPEQAIHANFKLFWWVQVSRTGVLTAQILNPQIHHSC